MRPDVIVATHALAQAIVAATKDIPVVFTPLPTPSGQADRRSREARRQRDRMTDLSPIGRHLELIARITPNASASASSPIRRGQFGDAGGLLKGLRPRGMTICEAAAPRSNDVLAAARSLVGKVDAIYVPTDNTVVSALEGVIKTAENKIRSMPATRSVPRAPSPRSASTTTMSPADPARSSPGCSRARSRATSRSRACRNELAVNPKSRKPWASPSPPRSSPTAQEVVE